MSILNSGVYGISNFRYVILKYLKKNNKTYLNHQRFPILKGMNSFIYNIPKKIIKDFFEFI